MGVTNDPKVIARLLRYVAGGSYAKENKTEHIFTAAADLLDPPASDVEPLYYVPENDGESVYQRPIRTAKGFLQLGFCVCTVKNDVDAAEVCAILNRGEPATE